MRRSSFKWAETQIPLSEVLKLTPEHPLFGHKSGKLNRTHWIAFLKDGLPAKGETAETAAPLFAVYELKVGRRRAKKVAQKKLFPEK